VGSSAASLPDEVAPVMCYISTHGGARRATPQPRYYAPRRARAMDLDIEALKAKLAALKTEHRDLDDVIARLVERGPFDQLQMQRLKKRKLMLKDQISKIESELLPDIIA
jgi:hypothetical protein